MSVGLQTRDLSHWDHSSAEAYLDWGITNNFWWSKRIVSATVFWNIMANVSFVLQLVAFLSNTFIINRSSIIIWSICRVQGSSLAGHTTCNSVRCISFHFFYRLNLGCHQPTLWTDVSINDVSIINHINCIYMTVQCTTLLSYQLPAQWLVLGSEPRD